MASIVELVDKLGNILLPNTIGDAVLIKDKTLTDYLGDIRDLQLIETTEDGFFITDEEGDIILNISQDGLNAIVNDTFNTSIIDYIKEHNIQVVADSEPSILFKYKRVSTGGIKTSNVYTSIINLGKHESGVYTFNIEFPNVYLYKDYFNLSLNTGYSLESVNITPHNIQVSVNIKESTNNLIFGKMEYTIMNEDDYSVVHISLESNNATSATIPVIPNIKYNKEKILSLTSDDQGLGDYMTAWAYFNGYCAATHPTDDAEDAGGTNRILNKRGDEYLTVTEINYQSSPSEIPENTNINIHTPLTYTDDTGAVRRYAATSAIFGTAYNDNNYTFIHPEDMRTMLRTGWSFGHHDGNLSTASTPELMAKQMVFNSDKWQEKIGQGLKCMIEPNGNHSYLDAGSLSSGIAVQVFQNGTTTYKELDKSVATWAAGNMTNYAYKPTGGYIRSFFQNAEENFLTSIENADGTDIIMGGSHGFALKFLKGLQDMQSNDNLWVASLDEIWEYYYNKNNVIIENITYDDGLYEFDIVVPKYDKHMFLGELTLNIPIADGDNIQFSNNVTIGAGRQNANYYTINIGLETTIYQYIEELLEFYEDNKFDNIKNDIQYLINRLKPGEIKTDYQSQLNTLI